MRLTARGDEWFDRFDGTPHMVEKVVMVLAKRTLGTLSSVRYGGLIALFVLALAAPAGASSAGPAGSAAPAAAARPPRACVDTTLHTHTTERHVHVTNNCASSYIAAVKVVIDNGVDSECHWISPGNTFTWGYSRWISSFDRVDFCGEMCTNNPPTYECRWT